MPNFMVFTHPNLLDPKNRYLSKIINPVILGLINVVGMARFKYYSIQHNNKKSNFQSLNVRQTFQFNITTTLKIIFFHKKSRCCLAGNRQKDIRRMMIWCIQILDRHIHTPTQNPTHYVHKSELYLSIYFFDVLQI